MSSSSNSEFTNEFKYVLLQKCNIFHPPIIPKPMIRIVGFARTEEEADAIKSKILNHKGTKYIPLFIEPVQCLQMVGITPRRHLDLECVKKKKDYVFEAHDSWNRKRNEMFEKRMESKTKSSELGKAIEHRNQIFKMQKDLQDAFPPPENVEDMLYEINHYSGNEDSDVIEKHLNPKPTAASANSSTFKGEYDKTFSLDESSMTKEEWDEMNYCLQIWPNELIITDQHWVSVTIIPDFTCIASNWIEATACGNEPFYIIHTTSQNSEDITKVTEKQIWKQFSDADTYIHPMYRWMDFTTIFDDNIKTTYMDPAQDEIMNGHQKQRQIVQKMDKLNTVRRINVSKVKDRDTTLLDLLGSKEGNFAKNSGITFGAGSANHDTLIDKEQIELDANVLRQLSKEIKDESNKNVDEILEEMEKQKKL